MWPLWRVLTATISHAEECGYYPGEEEIPCDCGQQEHAEDCPYVYSEEYLCTCDRSSHSADCTYIDGEEDTCICDQSSHNADCAYIPSEEDVCICDQNTHSEDCLYIEDEENICTCDQNSHSTDCSYIDGEEESCTCEQSSHSEGCTYIPSEENICICDQNSHSEDCTYVPNEEKYACICSQDYHTADCSYTPAVPEKPCTHEHEDCSYVESVEEDPCEFECEDCAGEEASGTCGENLTWKFDEATGTLTISGTGAMKNFVRGSYAPWYWYDINIESVVIQDGVTSVGSYAFYGCDELTDITLPNGITYVGDCSFIDCSSLGNITFPDSITWIGSSAFADCSSLTSITIPDGVTKIGGSAFYGCSNLASITIPDSVTDIGTYVFADCSSLTSITIPGRITRIDRNAFYNCSSLESISIPETVNSIEYEAFLNCSSLTSITIPNRVNYIDTYAFGNCSSLTSIIIPDSVSWIGSCAFSDCSSLRSITIPDSVSRIGDCAFSGCSGLTSITIPDSITSINDSTFRACSSLTSITIPDSVTSIGMSAFSDCSSLTSVTIPDSVASIGLYAFSDCSSLASIKIPDSVVSIGSFAFRNCNSLTSVTIPDSVTSVGGYAFSSCDNLIEILFYGDAPSFGETCFAFTTAIAYYPANNKTWTEDVMQDYGGNITWVSYSGEPIRELVIVVTAKDKVYDGTSDVTLEIVLNGVVQNDNIAAEGICGHFSDSNVGQNKTVSIDSSKVKLTGENTDNYVISQVNRTTTASITKANASVTTIPAAVTGLIYNNRNQDLITAGTATGGSMQYSLDGKSWSTTIPTGKDAGTFNVRYKVVGDGNHNDMEQQSITVTIDKAKVTITADNKTAAIGVAQPALTYTVTGLEGSDGLTSNPTLTCNATMSTAGEYEIAVSGGDAGANYEIQRVNGKLTVSDERLTSIVTAPTAKTLTYTGAAQALVNTGSTSSGTLQYSLDGITYSANIPTATNAGTYTVYYKVVGNSDYNDVAQQSLAVTIAKAKVTITAVDKTAAVGASKPTLSYTVAGLKGSEKLTTKPTLTCNANMSTAGEYEITVTGGDAGANYEIQRVNGKLYVKTEHKVTVASATNGTVSVSPEKAIEGTLITITVTPSSGYQLSTLTVKNAAGTSYTASADNNGKYGFTMPDVDVTVTATFTKTNTSTADTSNPKTGDGFHMAAWTAMAMTSLLCMAAMVLDKKKHR